MVKLILYFPPISPKTARKSVNFCKQFTVNTCKQFTDVYIKKGSFPQLVLVKLNKINHTINFSTP